MCLISCVNIGEGEGEKEDSYRGREKRKRGAGSVPLIRIYAFRTLQEVDPISRFLAAGAIAADFPLWDVRAAHEMAVLL